MQINRLNYSINDETNRFNCFVTADRIAVKSIEQIQFIFYLHYFQATPILIKIHYPPISGMQNVIMSECVCVSVRSRSINSLFVFAKYNSSYHFGCTVSSNNTENVSI